MITKRPKAFSSLSGAVFSTNRNARRLAQSLATGNVASTHKRRNKTTTTTTATPNKSQTRRKARRRDGGAATSSDGDGTARSAIKKFVNEKKNEEDERARNGGAEMKMAPIETRCNGSSQPPSRTQNKAIQQKRAR